jgi:hypothetical protein
MFMVGKWRISFSPPAHFHSTEGTTNYITPARVVETGSRQMTFIRERIRQPFKCFTTVSFTFEV